MSLWGRIKRAVRELFLPEPAKPPPIPKKPEGGGGPPVRWTGVKMNPRSDTFFRDYVYYKEQGYTIEITSDVSSVTFFMA